MDVENLLRLTLTYGASDLHLSAGLAPHVRVAGALQVLPGQSVIRQAALLNLLRSWMTEAEFTQYQAGADIDFAYTVSGLARFRINAFHQSRGAAAVCRAIHDDIKTLDDLGTPSVLQDIARHENGLVLVTGPTGSGKSTTLAAMLTYINAHRAAHILTLEDPIEFVHHSQQCVINQREIGGHADELQHALRAALRADPDVIMLGELRDTQTIRLALTAAETGHLVLATLHAASAARSIHRIVDVFPGEEKAMVRTLLSESLCAVIAQRLVTQTEGRRAAEFEILRNIPAVAHLIREGKLAQLPSVMQTNRAAGMQVFEGAQAGK